MGVRRRVHIEERVRHDVVVLGGPPRLHGAAVAARTADGDAAGAGEEGGGVGGGEGGGGGVEGDGVLLRDHAALDGGNRELRRGVFDGLLGLNRWKGRLRLPALLALALRLPLSLGLLLLLLLLLLLDHLLGVAP